ncbi:MAG: hypothetical protein ABIF77_19315 [bacterium]
MSTQTTLLTVHKGVDLHAATAERVMRHRLTDGDKLVALRRGEFYTFWESEQHDLSVPKLLSVARYFNPNKHSYGHFVLPTTERPWYQNENDRWGLALPAGWPGEPRDTDLGQPTADLNERMLGGQSAAGCVAVDVCAYALGASGPLLAGVLWRLILQVAAEQAATIAERFVTTRSGREGLLVNPHMQGWLYSVRTGSTAGRPG